MTKLKIKSAEFCPINSTASYYAPSNTIVYDKNLDIFPQLKQIVLEHEKKHAAHPYNIFAHIYRDFIDYPRIYFRKDFFRFMQLRDSRIRQLTKGGKFWMIIPQLVYHIITGIYNLILMIVWECMHIYYKKKWKKEA
jgi:hypothetical protein